MGSMIVGVNYYREYYCVLKRFVKFGNFEGGEW